MKLTSPAFNDNEMIPAQYTCQGKDINPPLAIEGTAGAAESLVLIFDDPDAVGGTWDHWIVFNIPAQTTSIKEDSVPGTQGVNSWGRNDYGGPCPPSGTHRYFFKLYSLKTTLDLPEGATKKEVEEAMESYVLEHARIIGLYKKT